MTAPRQSTYCPNCGQPLIARSWYDLEAYHIIDGGCEFCSAPIAGHFENAPGHWGTHRVPVDPAALLRELEGAR